MNYLKIPKMFKYLFQWKVTVIPSTKFVKNLVRSTTNTNNTSMQYRSFVKFRVLSLYYLTSARYPVTIIGDLFLNLFTQIA